jgi:hypothetical protein
VTYIDALIMLDDLTTAEAAITHALKFGLSPEYASELSSDIYAKQHSKSPKTPQAAAQNLPSIITLIPAYKPEYLAELFMALSAQTYKHFRVIVSDDSPEQLITQMLSSPQFATLVNKLNIQVIPGPRKGTMTNIVHLLSQCDAENDLIHVLFDDDLIYPSFYEKHVQAHLYENIGVSVSYRWYCNEKGQPTGVTGVPAFVNEAEPALIRLNAPQLFNSTIPDCNNWLGEFSNAVFKPEAVALYCRSHMAGMPYYGLGDIGVLLEIALHQDVALIKEYLGGFRQHDSQHSVSYDSRVFKCGLIAWVALALGAYQLEQISAEALQNVVSRMQRVLASRYQGVADMHDLLVLFSDEPATSLTFVHRFNTLWNELLACDDWISAQVLQGKDRYAMSSLSA